MIIMHLSNCWFQNLLTIILMQTFRKEKFTDSRRQSAPLNPLVHYFLR